MDENRGAGVGSKNPVGVIKDELVEAAEAGHVRPVEPPKAEDDKVVDTFLSRNETFEPICLGAMRRLAVQSMCERLNLTSRPAKVVPLLVDEEHKIAYCEISKAGSTSMKRVMALATRAGRKLPSNFTIQSWHRPAFLKRMGLAFKKSNEISLQFYTKFFIVRHPFDRLVSSYNDKVGPNSPGNGGYARFSRNIVKLNFPHLSDAELDRMPKPTFQQFVHALAGHQNLLRNNHWNPYADKYCDPCHIEYDHILRIESMSYDTLPIMRALKLGETFAEEARVKTYRNQRPKPSHLLVKDEPYARLRRLNDFRNVSEADLNVLEKYYDLEFKLYGYSFDRKTMLPGCKFDDTGCC